MVSIKPLMGISNEMHLAQTLCKKLGVHEAFMNAPIWGKKIPTIR